MRIITRYILREVTSHALLGGVLFTFVLFMRDLGRILELVVRDSASMADVARIFLYTLPNALTLTIPMAVLVGILLGLSRLAADSEITAMRAAGMGALDFVKIVSIVSIVALGLGLLNSLYLAPYSASALLTLEDNLKSSQASFEVEPRVFYEDFKNYVLYVQDIRPAAGAALWHHVFLANLTQPGPNITTADQAVVVNETNPAATPQSSPTTPPQSTSSIRLHLLNGGQHQIPTPTPTNTTSPPSPPPISPSRPAPRRTPTSAAPTPPSSLSRSPSSSGAANTPPHPTPASTASSSTNASPIPSPASSSCWSASLSASPPSAAASPPASSSPSCSSSSITSSRWSASPSPRAASSLPSSASGEPTSSSPPPARSSLPDVSRRHRPHRSSDASVRALNKLFARFAAKGTNIGSNLRPPDIATILRRLRGILGTRFPLILDDYVMREYVTNLALILAAFSSLFIIFTFFELIGDIIRNRTPLVTVGDYLLNLIPYIIYNVTPLCSLVAVLITFGALNRSSELTAMKATGISLYRVVAPVLVIALLISAALFAFDDLYLPDANRRQDALRSIIKGKPAQTFLRPDRQWISGQATPPPTTEANSADPTAHPAATPARIFYYQFFDPYKNVFANLTVFEFDPNSFVLTRRIFATSARWDDRVSRWVFENGWQRTFSGETVSSYQPFTLSTFPEIREQPSYFTKEDLQAQEMNYGELSRYITDLKQSGFDTKRLAVQLYKKIADPLTTLVMAILAVPFALSMGKRGGLVGIATAIGLAISYWVIAGIFSAMGNVNTLPAFLAAWSPDLLFGIVGAYLLLRSPT